MHYKRWQAYGDPATFLKPYTPIEPGQRCGEVGCDELVWANSLCKRHSMERWKQRDRGECVAESCQLPVYRRDYCVRHYQRWRKYGDPWGGGAFRRKRGTGLPKWAYWQRRDEQRLAMEPELLNYVWILKRDPCSYCGAPCEHIDHIVPVDAGGMLTIDNITAACAACNLRKHTASLLEFLLR